jgi:dipeptidyl aminopeptidase/acylaminoacyl peptidase
LDLDKDRTKERYTVSNIFGATLSPDGKWLAITFDRSSVVKTPKRDVLQNDRVEKTALVDAAAGTIVHLLDGRNNLAFSPDSQNLLTIGVEATAHFWSVSTGKQVRELTLEYAGTPIFTPSGADIIIADRLRYDSTEPMVNLYDVANGKVIQQFPKQYVEITGFALSPDGRMVAIGGFNSGLSSLKLWKLNDPNTPEPKDLLSSDNQVGDNLVFSADGKLIASSGCSHGRMVVSVVNLSDSKSLIEFPMSLDVKSLAFSPDGSRLAIGTEEGRIIVKRVPRAPRSQ